MCCRSFSQKEQHYFELFYSDFHLTNVAVKSFAAVYTYTIEKFVVGLMFFMFFFHQGCIYLINNTVILWNIITI